MVRVSVNLKGLKMSVIDKVEIIKNILQVVIKIADVLLAVIDKVLEKVGN